MNLSSNILNVSYASLASLESNIPNIFKNSAYGIVIAPPPNASNVVNNSFI
ncbi:hypothetical protein [Sulfolobus spindle-shaped virus]|nr:hypothetical protein [Sulfolobus spindle-shaped virus]